jgi:septum site-determining protein MinD
MPKTVVVHSSSDRAGRTAVAAALAVSLAKEGQRVAIVDADLAAPSLHRCFGIDASSITWTVNDVLAGQTTLSKAAVNLTPYLQRQTEGRLYLAPARQKGKREHGPANIEADPAKLAEGLHGLGKEFGLDVFVINAQAGLDRLALSCIALADILLIVLTLNKQDYLSTGVTLDLARKLEVPDIILTVNRVPERYDLDRVKERVETTFNCGASVLIPLRDELKLDLDDGVSVAAGPSHPIVALARDIGRRVSESRP